MCSGSIANSRASANVTTAPQVLAYRYDGAGVFTFNIHGASPEIGTDQGAVSGMVSTTSRTRFLIGARNDLGTGFERRGPLQLYFCVARGSHAGAGVVSRAGWRSA